MSAELLRAMFEKFNGISEADAKKLAETAQTWACIQPSLRSQMDYFVGFCESPMERSFLLGLLTRQDVIGKEYDGQVLRFVVEDAGYELTPQYEVFDYDEDPHDCPFARIDFVLRGAGCWFSLAIEIDGHEFHEKTKEQAQRDKARDRRLVRCGGHRVLRFTGAEVYANAEACWDEVLDAAVALRDSDDQRVFALKAAVRGQLLEELTAPARQLPESATGASSGPMSSSESNEGSVQQ